MGQSIIIVVMQCLVRRLCRPFFSYGFCSAVEVRPLFRELLSHYRSYRPFKSIQLVHRLTMTSESSQQVTQAQLREEGQQVEHILNAISS